MYVYIYAQPASQDPGFTNKMEFSFDSDYGLNGRVAPGVFMKMYPKSLFYGILQFFFFQCSLCFLFQLFQLLDPNCGTVQLFFSFSFTLLLQLCTLCYAMVCFTLLHHTILSYAMLYYTILRYTIRYYTILYYIILYCIVQYYGMLSFIMPYYVILLYIVSRYTVLYYTILYCT